MRDESEIADEAFLMFAREEDNGEILKKCKELRSQELCNILQIKVETVVNEMETFILKKKPFSKDSAYEDRRKETIEEIVGSNRLNFHGQDANKLGQSTLKNFLKICKHHAENGHLKRYSPETISRVFRRWFYPGRQELISKHLRKYSPDFRMKELNRKKKAMEKLRIEHEILLKRSQLLNIEEEIEQMEKEILPIRKPKCKVQQQESEEEEEVTTVQINRPRQRPSAPNLAKPVAQPFPPSKKENPKHQKSPSSTKQNHEWTYEQQAYFISVLPKMSIRDQQPMVNLMQSQFGKHKKFTLDTIRMKKARMFHICKAKFLHTLKKKEMLSRMEYENLKMHMENINNLRAHKFITTFVNRYYYIVFESQPDRVMREIIEEVLRLPTRIQNKGKPENKRPKNQAAPVPSKPLKRQKIEQSEYRP